MGEQEPPVEAVSEKDDLEVFAGCGRTGRRNAVADVSADCLEASTATLAERLAHLETATGEPGADASQPSTSQASESQKESDGKS